MESFEKEYAKLNKEQRQAVDAIDGPVMVVAGPGTGKTQVLTLRIAHILTEAAVPANSILCLTFTNAGVRAMRERLLRLIGSRASEVYIATFHRFAIGLIEKHYALLDLEQVPELLGETEAVALVDEILETGQWQYIRPRTDAAKYFSDLKSLVSLLKRENLSPTDFADDVEDEIARIKNDPDNLSSRGARKGELKREAEKQIESLYRTQEVVAFYQEYERIKRERILMDYDDVLAYAVALVQGSEDVRADIRENYLYVHVDEHQDSSGIQNAFLEAVWADTEKPNIFVVGDDRQLIYAFNGASFEHFTHFRSMFGKAQEITLTQNYRSSQTILDAGEALLASRIAHGKLVSSGTQKEHLLLRSECEYPRDEILLAGLEIQTLLASGTSPSECAILIPKNRDIRNAVEVLRTLGIPVAHSGSTSFFLTPEVATLRRVLAVIADPFNNTALAGLVLDSVVEIPPLVAHAFLRQMKMRDFSLEHLIAYARTVLPTDPIARLGSILADCMEISGSFGLHGLVQKIGEEMLFARVTDHDVFVRRVEVVRTFLHLLTAFLEKNAHATLPEFLEYLDRLESYGHDLPLAVFAGTEGVCVQTLHGSKGLEYENVWIAHLDESSLMRGRRNGFTLPEKIQSLATEKDEATARRELYVAITRAKERCSLSWSRRSYTGGDKEPAKIIFDIPNTLVADRSLEDTEQFLLSYDPKIFVARAPLRARAKKKDLAAIVAEEYTDRNVTVTLLNNFFTCPWTWYFRNMLQVPEAKTESLLVGTIVHAGIEYLLKNRDLSSSEALRVVLMNALDKEYVRDEKVAIRILRESMQVLSVYEKKQLTGVSKNAQSERSVSYKDPKRPHLSLYGKIDLTEYEDDRIVTVTDFKTGSIKNARTIEKLDDEGRLSSLMRQLAMYSYLIENAEKGTRVQASRLLFVEHLDESDSLYSKQIGNEEIELLKKDIADYDELLQGGKWIERPCNTETYGKSTGCEYCALAERLYE